MALTDGEIKNLIILGIDPGTASLGYGLIEAQKNDLRLVAFGCLKTGKDLAASLRLRFLFRELTKLIKKHKPDSLATEQLFFFKNMKTAIRVSQSQGIVMLAGANFDIPVLEYTPLQVKQAVTGYGLAQKQQVQKMVKVILRLEEIPKPDDAADALAVAICNAHCQKFLKITQTLDRV